jgi:hypothetical protein
LIKIKKLTGGTASARTQNECDSGRIAGLAAVAAPTFVPAKPNVSEFAILHFVAA